MIIGNKSQIELLKKLADAHTLSHGYLFFGPRGVGKKTIAIHLAQYLEKKEWDGAGMLIDTLVVTPESGGSIGIPAARGITSHLGSTPLVGSSRIVIIDDAHTLTTEAQNALLKVSEDPAQGALIIYVTHDPDALLPTLLSRLQRFYFGTVAKNDIAQWLTESLGIAGKEVEEIAGRAAGSPGIACHLLNDEVFKVRLESAKHFRTTKESDLTAFLKTLTEPDDFNFGRFLDALTFLESFRARGEKGNAEAWHTLLTLRANVERFNLNPKIQLRALHRQWQSRVQGRKISKLKFQMSNQI